MGKQHWERICEHDEQTAREALERIEAENEPSPPQPDVQDNNPFIDESQESYNHQAGLDVIDLAAMGPAARLLETNILTGVNLDDKISIDDLINAEIEQILQAEDADLFEGLDNLDVDGDNEPDEGSMWFPFKYKMELVGSILMGHTVNPPSGVVHKPFT
ncbi:hypothetical protein PGT21_016675 [Puccinia graminis f. sp. tritici]|uniref:Uncharacterized protein n=1 Tax=Puccinia graminis f. sp. tritici TaxID=56615 RepID=A0A5B0MM69_PUCGR|nr:hypothetical protein PGT21_016675 [Puccinia graminis f. sp. tritici]